MARGTPESIALGKIGKHLEDKGYFFYRQNNIPVYDPRHQIFRKPPKYSKRGVPDFFVLHKGVAYFIEVKGIGKGNRKGAQSEHQKQFMHEVENCGGVYVLAYSIEDLTKAGL